MTHSPLKATLLAGLAASLLGLATLCRAAEVSVFAAASLSDVFRELSPQFTAASGHTLRFNFGASGLLARQIKEGAPADAIFSADELRVDQLEKAGLLRAGTRHTFLANTLVVIVNASSKTPGAPQVSLPPQMPSPGSSAALLAALADLEKPGVRHLAIGDPASVPAGTYAKEYLVKLGLWDSLGKKVVPLESVRSVLAAVEAGNAEAGFVYRTDALISKKVRVAVEIPQDQGPRIHYPGAVLKNAPQPEAAETFLAWLQGPVAQAAFAKYGFIVVR